MEGVIQAGAAAGLELRGLEDFEAVVVAHQRLLHDAAHPSHVVLPVIPR